MRAQLRGLLAGQRAARSAAAARHLLASVAWRDARTVAVFLSMPDEIDTTTLVEAAWSSGRRVLAPRVDPASRSLALVPIHGWTDCLPGFRGILEPITGGAAELATIDLMLVPGLAFDVHGGRLGQGGGYYDRLLARPDARVRTCGLAFEFQVVPAVPSEPHDRRVDLLATDARFRRCA